LGDRNRAFDRRVYRADVDGAIEPAGPKRPSRTGALYQRHVSRPWLPLLCTRAGAEPPGSLPAYDARRRHARGRVSRPKNTVAAADLPSPFHAQRKAGGTISAAAAAGRSRTIPAAA